MFLLYRDDSVLVEEEWGVVYKTVLRSRKQFWKVYTPAELIKREAKALQLLEWVEWVQRLVSMDNEVLKTYLVLWIPLRTMDRRRTYAKMASNILNNMNKAWVIKILGGSSDVIVTDNGITFIDFGNIVFQDESVVKRILWRVWQDAKIHLLFKDRV